MGVRSRFAPSPTGYLHIGGVRTALYAWLFARHHGGHFALRIEDTDTVRSTQAAVDAIFEGLAWLGIDSDEQPIFQTKRFPRYAEVCAQLVAAGKAYHCYCSREELDAMRAEAQAAGKKPRYDGRCRNLTTPRPGVAPVVRFKNPEGGQVVVDDAVKGRIVFDNAELDDLIIARSDGTPTYNFTVVVDDSDMGITHVIRGDDHVNNTPRQINMLAALGARVPQYAHLPMIHGPDGAKLSKRHGAVNVLEYRDQGFLPEALLNYLLRLGWSHGDQEIFTVAEMIERFDLPQVNHSAAQFDPKKLLWVNQQHMLRAPRERLGALLAAELARRGIDAANGPPAAAAADALRERSQTLVEMADQAHYYYADFADYDVESAKTHLKRGARDCLAALADGFAATTEWSDTIAQSVVERVAEGLGLKLGKVAQPLRVALVGRAASPGIGVTLALVGRDRAIARVRRALAHVEALPAGEAAT